jgi:hypothetical protein
MILYTIKMLIESINYQINNMDYKQVINQDEYNNVCIDFDGVIHNNFDGFGDGTIYGPIIPGASEAIKILSTKYNIIIFTAKAKPDRPLINGKNGIELVWEWLTKHNLDSYIKQVTAEKPRALTYIDDKAIRFTDWNSTLSQFQEIYENK